MKLYDLEDLIMAAWNTKEDIDLIAWKMFDSESKPSEDTILNLLHGIQAIHEVRMEKLFQGYADLCKNRKSL